jgi:hypothetical protein
MSFWFLAQLELVGIGNNGIIFDAELFCGIINLSDLTKQIKIFILA